MLKKVIGFVLSMFAGNLWAAGPQSSAQLYSLVGEHKDQVVMLSNYSDGNRFASYEEKPESARKYFAEGRQVWIWCAGKAVPNVIKKIATDERGWTIVDLSANPSCGANPLLMSNYEFPKRKWTATNGTEEERRAILEKLGVKEELKITKILSAAGETFFLVFNPRMKSIYDTGGYWFLDRRLNLISLFESATLTPLIDLNADGVPEFFHPSTDGVDAWLYMLFPKLEMNNALQHK